jgi:hypothetical protein
MEIFGCTYRKYIEKYEERLRTYKEKFEDRNESIFLEREITNFKDFHNVLASIHNSLIKHKDYSNVINDAQFKSHFDYLENNYNNVFKELFKIGPVLLDANKNVSHPDDIKEDDIRGYIFNFDVIKEKLDNFIVSTKRIIEFIQNRIANPKDIKTEDLDKTRTWFKVGLLLAKGTVQNLYKKYKSEKGHFKKITLELGFKETDRPYFSETINNTTVSDKNIYSNLSKMKKIRSYCKKYNILICEDFDKKFKTLQTKQT